MLFLCGHTVELELDAMFPGNPDAGFTLSRAILAEFPNLPIIMVTSINKYSIIRFESRDIGPMWLPVDRFVEKPIRREVLLSLVDEPIKKEEK